MSDISRRALPLKQIESEWRRGNTGTPGDRFIPLFDAGAMNGRYVRAGISRRKGGGLDILAWLAAETRETTSLIYRAHETEEGWIVKDMFQDYASRPFGTASEGFFHLLDLLEDLPITDRTDTKPVRRLLQARLDAMGQGLLRELRGCHYLLLKALPDGYETGVALFHSDDEQDPRFGDLVLADCRENIVTASIFPQGGSWTLRRQAARGRPVRDWKTDSSDRYHWHDRKTLAGAIETMLEQFYFRNERRLSGHERLAQAGALKGLQKQVEGCRDILSLVRPLPDWVPGPEIHLDD